MSDDPPSSPCRLFVYLAKEAPIGVVLRRGPSDWARLSVWYVDSDTFEHGQWIKGRVYERRCDVSTDGSLFAAFIRQSGARIEKPPAAESWVAVSRPPYFTALALWFVGGTYHTGPFFPDRFSLWHGFQEQPPDIGRLPAWLKTKPPTEIPYIDGTSEWTDRTVHFNRLIRDGWKKKEGDAYRTIWEREHISNSLVLSMTHVYKDLHSYGGPYVVSYTVSRTDGAEIELGEATWADWDHQGRLALARGGCLLFWDEKSGFREINDFNGQTPDPQPPPPWAEKWPQAPLE